MHVHMGESTQTAGETNGTNVLSDAAIRADELRDSFDNDTPTTNGVSEGLVSRLNENTVPDTVDEDQDTEEDGDETKQKHRRRYNWKDKHSNGKQQQNPEKPKQQRQA